MSVSSRNCGKCGHLVGPLSVICGACGEVLAETERLSPGSFSDLVPGTSSRAFDPREFSSLLKADAGVLRRLFAEVIESSHVRANAQYSGAGRRCEVHFCADAACPVGALVMGIGADDFECEECNERIGSGKDAVIVMPASFFVMAGVMSVYVAAPLLLDRSPSRLAVARHRLGECTVLLRPPDYASGPAARSLLDRAQRAASDPAALALARDVAGGMARAVIAHEFGHFVYGHVAGRKRSWEISRNNERDADSFAASVLSSMPNPDRSLIGAALLWAVLAHRSRQSGRDHEEATHPRDTSRLDSLVVSMPSAVGVLRSAHGLSETDLRQVAG